MADPTNPSDPLAGLTPEQRQAFIRKMMEKMQADAQMSQQGARPFPGGGTEVPNQYGGSNLLSEQGRNLGAISVDPSKASAPIAGQHEQMLAQGAAPAAGGQYIVAGPDGKHYLIDENGRNRGPIDEQQAAALQGQHWSGMSQAARGEDGLLQGLMARLKAKFSPAGPSAAPGAGVPRS